VKLVSYNIQYGFGADGRYDLERIAEVVAGADIIALQEVERHWRRTGEADQPEILGGLLPEHNWVYGPAFDMDASYRDAEGRLVNRRRQFGTMLLSRLPIAWSRLHLLPMRRMISPLNTQNPALECMIRTPFGPVRFFSLHLAHVGAEERLEQIDFLLDRHRRVSLEGGPWSGADDEPHRDWTHGEPEPEAPLAAVLMGDFNSEPGSAEYRRLSGDQPYRPIMRARAIATASSTRPSPPGTGRMRSTRTYATSAAGSKSAASTTASSARRSPTACAPSASTTTRSLPTTIRSSSTSTLSGRWMPDVARRLPA